MIDGVEHYSMQRIYSTEENNCVMLDQLLNKWTCKNVFNCAHLPPYWKTKNSICEVYFAYVMQSIRIRQIDTLDKSSYTIKSKFSLYFLTAVLEGTEYQGFIL